MLDTQVYVHRSHLGLALIASSLPAHRLCDGLDVMPGCNNFWLLCRFCFLILFRPECVWGSARFAGVQGSRGQKVQIHLTSLQHVQSRMGLADTTRHVLRCCDGAVQCVLHRRWWRPDPQHDRQWHRSGDSVHYRWAAGLQDWGRQCL